MQQSTSSVVRRLVVMRHGKAEATGPSDRERALASRGRDDAAEAGRWLRDHGVDHDAALVSDALRTQQTWAALAEGAGWDLEPELSSSLYAAGPDAAIDLVRETDPGATTLVVVGHNPTMAYVAELLDDGEGDGDATTALITRGFPTSALALFTVHGDWTTVGAGTCRLESFHVGEG